MLPFSMMISPCRTVASGFPTTGQPSYGRQSVFMCRSAARGPLDVRVKIQVASSTAIGPCGGTCQECAAGGGRHPQTFEGNAPLPIPFVYTTAAVFIPRCRRGCPENYPRMSFCYTVMGSDRWPDGRLPSPVRLNPCLSVGSLGWCTNHGCRHCRVAHSMPFRVRYCGRFSRHRPALPRAMAISLRAAVHI